MLLKCGHGSFWIQTPALSADRQNGRVPNLGPSAHTKNIYIVQMLSLSLWHEHVLFGLEQQRGAMHTFTTIVILIHQLFLTGYGPKTFPRFTDLCLSVCNVMLILLLSWHAFIAWALRQDKMENDFADARDGNVHTPTEKVSQRSAELIGAQILASRRTEGRASVGEDFASVFAGGDLTRGSIASAAPGWGAPLVRPLGRAPDTSAPLHSYVTARTDTRETATSRRQLEMGQGPSSGRPEGHGGGDEAFRYSRENRENSSRAYMMLPEVQDEWRPTSFKASDFKSMLGGLKVKYGQWTGFQRKLATALQGVGIQGTLLDSVTGQPVLPCLIRSLGVNYSHASTEVVRVVAAEQRAPRVSFDVESAILAIVSDALDDSLLTCTVHLKLSTVVELLSKVQQIHGGTGRGEYDLKNREFMDTKYDANLPALNSVANVSAALFAQADILDGMCPSGNAISSHGFRLAAAFDQPHLPGYAMQLNMWHTQRSQFDWDHATVFPILCNIEQRLKSTATTQERAPILDASVMMASSTAPGSPARDAKSAVRSGSANGGRSGVGGNGNRPANVGGGNANSGQRPRSCFRCGGEGHIQDECGSRQQSDAGRDALSRFRADRGETAHAQASAANNVSDGIMYESGKNAQQFRPMYHMPPPVPYMYPPFSMPQAHAMQQYPRGLQHAPLPHHPQPNHQVHHAPSAPQQQQQHRQILRVVGEANQARSGPPTMVPGLFGTPGVHGNLHHF